jgi:hypothetical protein
VTAEVLFWEVRMALALTDAQLDQIRAAAAPIPVRQRREYLERVAELLAGRPFNSADVLKAVTKAQHELIGTPEPA